MRKKEAIKEVKRGIEALNKAAKRVSNDSVEISSIEIDHMLQEAVKLYSNLHLVHDLNQQPGNRDLYNKPAGDGDQEHPVNKGDAEKSIAAESPVVNPETPEQQTESHKKEKIEKHQATSRKSNLAKSEVAETDKPDRNQDKRENSEETDFPEEIRSSGKKDEKQADAGNEKSRNSGTVSEGNEKNEKSSLNDRFYNEEKLKRELGEKLKNKRVSNLKSAISLNQKVGFIKHLFNGEEKNYKKAIDFINKCGNYAEAKFYIQEEVKPKYNWKEDDPMYKEFMDLVFRRFI